MRKPKNWMGLPIKTEMFLGFKFITMSVPSKPFVVNGNGDVLTLEKLMKAKALLDKNK